MSDERDERAELLMAADLCAERGMDRAAARLRMEAEGGSMELSARQVLPAVRLATDRVGEFVVLHDATVEEIEVEQQPRDMSLRNFDRVNRIGSTDTVARIRLRSERAEFVREQTAHADALDYAAAILPETPLDEEFDDLRANGWTDAELATLRAFYAESESDEYDYQDNYRMARVGNDEEVAEYERIRQRGCCGHFDEVRDGVMFGFNYGH